MFKKKQIKLNLSDYIRPLSLQSYTVIVNDITKSKSNKKINSNADLSTPKSIDGIDASTTTNEAIIISENDIAIIVYQLSAFMEKHLGIDSPKPRPLNKIPAKIFRNVTLNGSLHLTITLAISYFNNKYNWNDFDLISDESSYDHTIEFLKLLTKELHDPKIFLLSNIPNDQVVDLSNIILSHNGLIVDKEIDATHIVEWNEDIDNISNENNEEFIRVVDFQPNESNGLALIHWWYYPDHYDEWMPVESVEGYDSSELIDTSIDNKLKVYHVACKYIRDCDLFNQWCSEYDYEIDIDNNLMEEEDGDSNKTSLPRKQRSRKKLDSNKIKKETPIMESVYISDKYMQNILPPSIAQKQQTVNDSEIVIINANEQGSWSHNDTNKRKADTNDNKQDIKRNKLTSSTTRRPNWLSSDSISVIERKYLPELFQPNSSITTTEYLALRNFICNLYYQNPTVYLSYTDCRKKLSGDIGVIMMIHEFLDGFGVINYAIKSDVRPPPTLFYLSNDAKDATIDKSKDIELIKSYADDYINNRLSTLELKVQLLSKVEEILNNERQRLEIERNDIVVQRAQLTYIQQTFNPKI